MDVPASASPTGDALLNELVQLTGLPEEWAAQELKQLLASSGVVSARGDWTLEQIRHVLLECMERISPEQP